MTLEEFKKWLNNEIEMVCKGMNSKIKDVREKSFTTFSTYKVVKAKLEEVAEIDKGDKE